MTRNDLLERYAKGERNFSGLDLSGADFSRGIFIGADFSYSNLRGSDFSYSDLSYSRFIVANLIETNFSGATLIETNFQHSVLKCAEFAGGNLSRVNFRWSDLSGVDFRRVDLSDVDFSGAIGIKWADCSWFGQGVFGRRLLAVDVCGELRFFCGCFRGSESELREYIAEGEEKYRKSRTRALEFVLGCFEEE